MSVKEELVEMLVGAGYDVMTSCEEAERVVKEATAHIREHGTPYRCTIRATGGEIVVNRGARRALYAAVPSS